MFNSIVGNPTIDWLSMLGLLGIGTALVLGVALRVAAASGTVLLGHDAGRDLAPGHGGWRSADRIKQPRGR